MCVSDKTLMFQDNERPRGQIELPSHHAFVVLAAKLASGKARMDLGEIGQAADTATFPNPMSSCRVNRVGISVARDEMRISPLGGWGAIDKGANKSTRSDSVMNRIGQAAYFPLAIACMASHPRLGTPSFRKRFDT